MNDYILPPLDLELFKKETNTFNSIDKAIAEAQLNLNAQIEKICEQLVAEGKDLSEYYVEYDVPNNTNLNIITISGHVRKLTPEERKKPYGTL